MNYREEVKRTCPQIETDSYETKLTLGTMGLFGEAGEFVDVVKKHLFHGKPWDVAVALKELGDVCWYLEYLKMIFKLDDFKEDSIEREAYDLSPGNFTRSLEIGSLTLAHVVGMWVDNAHYSHRRREPVNPSVARMDLYKVHCAIESLALICGANLAQVREMNVAKLRARYPEGFNFAAAAARADERSRA